MSITSSAYNQKSFQGSSEADDVCQQLRIVIDENNTLKEALQDLIQVNTQLTESIEEYNLLHAENYGRISQVELENLAEQITDLQNQLQKQRQINMELSQQFHVNQHLIQDIGHSNNSACFEDPNQKIFKQDIPLIQSQSAQPSVTGNGQDDYNVEEILKVIEQLASNFQQMQQQYQQELSNLRQELINHQSYSQQTLYSMQAKLSELSSLYKELISELKSKDQIISNLKRDISIQKNKKSQVHKQMKISLTIQDLKNTLQSKIDEKDRVIKRYETLIGQLRDKFNQCFPIPTA